MARGAGRAMRLLPVRADHERGGAARRGRRSDRRRYRQCDGRQSLSLRHLSPYPRGDQESGRAQAGEGFVMSRLGKIARRTFLIGAAAIAGGVAVGYYYYRKPYTNPLEDDLAAGEATFNPYVKIASDGAITIIAPRAEMGQGVSTSLAALVA